MKFKFKEGDKVRVCSRQGISSVATIITQKRERRNRKYINRYIVENRFGWRKAFDEEKLVKEESDG